MIFNDSNFLMRIYPLYQNYRMYRSIRKFSCISSALIIPRNDGVYSGGPMKEGKGSHKIVLHERIKRMAEIPFERLVGT